MPSINVDLDYFEHPKIIRLVGLLGKGSEVLPLRLWCYAGKYHAEDGKLIGYSAQEIEASIKWWGRAGDCTAALIRVVLLDQIEGGYAVHDWLEHAGHIAAYRRKGKEMAAKRWGIEQPKDWPLNADSNAAFNAVSMLLALLTAMPTMYVGSVLYWGEEEIKGLKGGVGGASSPRGAYRHPVMLALRELEKNGTKLYPHLRWVALKQGIEPPAEVEATIAEIDRMVAVYGQKEVIAELAKIGGISIAEARSQANRNLAKAYPQKTAQATNTAKTDAKQIDWGDAGLEIMERPK